ncbi:MAG: secondary thiamine-phosphate synthase enzyme YjbQ [Candidatus Liptonbacteria bacterium]|nr:secondary thiamine-phosphate synthase enzyme YjbQ [Candidatus Liptonbacteria bacterium]
MKFYSQTVVLNAKSKRKTTSLVPFLSAAVKKSGVRKGTVTVQSHHTTAGIISQENEAGILRYDLPRLLDTLVPGNIDYRHDDMGKRRPRVGPRERKNARAHLEYALVAHPSVTLIVRYGKIVLGDWLSVLFVDFDRGRRKARKISIAVMGE